MRNARVGAMPLPSQHNGQQSNEQGDRRKKGITMEVSCFASATVVHVFFINSIPLIDATAPLDMHVLCTHPQFIFYVESTLVFLSRELIIFDYSPCIFSSSIYYAYLNWISLIGPYIFPEFVPRYCFCIA